MRDTWGKRARTQGSRDATIEAIAVALGEGQTLPKCGPWYVRMTRLSSNRLDGDNLARAFKSVRDTVAQVLHVDDGSAIVEWSYEQAKSGKGEPRAAVLEVWGLSQGA